MSELACLRWVENQFLREIYQPFDANPDQTTDCHLAASNRFCEIFDEFALYSENVEVISPSEREVAGASVQGS
jgi:hypothetical protein